MKSQLEDILKPGTAALLDAIDNTMNSNTFLLKGLADEPITPENDLAFLTSFLRSDAFYDMFMEVDRLRRLLSYAYFYVNDEGEMIPPEKALLKEPLNVIWQPMNEQSFVKRLFWMLCEAFSPYDKHVSSAQATELIGAFCQEVFGPKSWPLDAPEAVGHWQKHGWTFRDVQPNFLDSIGYYHPSESNEPEAWAYFDGAEEDTCTFFYQGQVFYLLLTDGCP